MSLPQSKISVLPLSQERRRFQRVQVDLLGRYMLSDRSEYPCQVTDMSPGGMALNGPVIGQMAERVIAYIDHVGRLEGEITRRFDSGFAMTVVATRRKRDKLAAQLTWLANRDILGIEDDRRHARETLQTSIARMILPNGINLSVRIIDISESGAAIGSTHRPDLGTSVVIGKASARVIRHLDDGFAVEFMRLQHTDFLGENLTSE
jgi:hypothetical protein